MSDDVVWMDVVLIFFFTTIEASDEVRLDPTFLYLRKRKPASSIAHFQKMLILIRWVRIRKQSKFNHFKLRLTYIFFSCRFGSTNRSSVTGIVYNNEMNDFSIPIANDTIPPSPMNSVHSGKRPTSSMSPMILTDKTGDVRMVIGGVGGRRIIPAVSQVQYWNFTLINNEFNFSIDNYRRCVLSKTKLNLQAIWFFTQKAHEVKKTSLLRLLNVTKTSKWRRFNVLCLLGNSD